MEDLSFSHQKIVDVDLGKEMKKSFLAYAMSVIVARALPDARDGLKPVHRRILYAMYEDNYTADKPYRKCAATVGNVLGRYHPHGDAAVYDALARLAQDFSMRYPLIDGHGNFGSIDGDPPAAYRYTEARLSRMAASMMEDLEKDTVDMASNFDDTRREPVVVPSRFPNLLVNGSTGIAVGMATNIPPHNLREVCEGVFAMIDDPDITSEELMKIIPGPDFPTGGTIMGLSGIRSAYVTGKGHIQVRAKAEIEEWKDGRNRIVITEIPYMVNKARLVESIAELHHEKRVEGITDLRDESDRTGMRIVIELRKDANADVILNQLFKYTQLQDTVAVNMLALVNGEPKVLNLRGMIRVYLDHQYDVVRRRCEFDLKKARERAHILEGLAIACDNIDEVIRIIRSSYDNARENLMAAFGISEIQAQAILDMRLARLQGLEREKIEEELAALRARIAELEHVLADPALVYAIVREELSAICKKYGDERRTMISQVENELDIADLIPEEHSVYTLSRLGYIKRAPVTTFRVQNRGGRGVTGQTTRNEDSVETIFTASSHALILFFTNKGREFRLKGYQIPESSRTARGLNIVNLLQLNEGERVTAMVHVEENDYDGYMVFVTRGGTVKRMTLQSLYTARKTGIRVINLDEGDELTSAHVTSGSDTVMIATRAGSAVHFPEEEIRPMGREAGGVRGIRLQEGDEVVGSAVPRIGQYVLTVTENGYGKMSDPSEYGVHHRGGSGLTAHRLTAKTGALVSLKAVSPEDELLLMNDQGIVIRLHCDSIRICGRTSQGVILMRSEDGKVISAASSTRQEEEDAGIEAEDADAGTVEIVDEEPTGENDGAEG